jgi:CRISPR/Cas system-associated endonuclease Cas1
MNPINSFISFSNVILTDPFASALYSFQEPKIKKIV